MNFLDNQNGCELRSSKKSTATRSWSGGAFYEQASSATLRSTATKGQPSAGWLLGCSNKPPQLRFGAQRRRASRRLADFLDNQYWMWASLIQEVNRHQILIWWRLLVLRTSLGFAHPRSQPPPDLDLVAVACSTNKPPRYASEHSDEGPAVGWLTSWTTRMVVSLLSYASEHSDEGPAVGWLTSWTTRMVETLIPRSQPPPVFLVAVACSTNKPPQLRFGAQRRRASRSLADFLDNQNGCELRSSKKSTATRSWSRGCLFYEQASSATLRSTATKGQP